MGSRITEEEQIFIWHHLGYYFENVAHLLDADVELVRNHASNFEQLETIVDISRRAVARIFLDDDLNVWKLCIVMHTFMK